MFCWLLVQDLTRLIEEKKKKKTTQKLQTKSTTEIKHSQPQAISPPTSNTQLETRISITHFSDQSKTHF
jgi:hypothetical protein